MARKEHGAQSKLNLHRAQSAIYTFGLPEFPRVSGVTDVTPTQVDDWYMKRFDAYITLVRAYEGMPKVDVCPLGTLRPLDNTILQVYMSTQGVLKSI